MESISSLTNSKISILDEFNAFNKTFHTYSKARLIDNKANILESACLGFNRADRMTLADMVIKPEDTLGTKTITDCFPESFFKTL